MCISMVSYFSDYAQHHNATLVVNRYDGNMIIMYVAVDLHEICWHNIANNNKHNRLSYYV